MKFSAIVLLFILSVNYAWSAPSTTSSPTTVSEEQQKIDDLLKRADNLEKEVTKMIEMLSKSALINHLEIERLRRDYLLLLAESAALRNAKTEVFKKITQSKLLDLVVAIEQYLKIVTSNHHQETTPKP